MADEGNPTGKSKKDFHSITYEQFDESVTIEYQNKYQKKHEETYVTKVRKALVETLKSLSMGPVDNDSFKQLRQRQGGYADACHILNDIKGIQNNIFDGEEYVGLANNVRKDIERYGMEKFADGLIEEFTDAISGKEWPSDAAQRWKKKYE